MTVIGKAHFDVGHAPKDQSNRRKYLPDYAAWEIHPVMKLNSAHEEWQRVEARMFPLWSEKWIPSCNLILVRSIRLQTEE
jgi:hypothetical protein